MKKLEEYSILPLLPSQPVADPQVSPSGDKLLFTYSKINYEKDNYESNIWQLPIDGGEPYQFTSGVGKDSNPRWSPDGKSIALVTDMDPPADVLRAHYYQKIYKLSVNGGKPSLLWEGEEWDVGLISSLTWSPDGHHLAFSGRIIGDLSEDIYKNHCVWVIPSKGRKPVNLTEAQDQSVRTWNMGLIWSSDSKEIYYTVPNQGSTNIYKVNVKSKGIEAVTNEKFTVVGFSVTDQGSKIALVATNDLTPNEIWIKDKAGVKQVTHMNKEYDSVKLSEPEEFWVKTSEGIDVHSWIMKPVNFKEGVKYPTILEIHGGPHGMCGYGLNHGYQTLAAHGYVVIYTNPRASTGYGEAFAAPVYGLWGVLDSRDIMEALDYAIKKYSYIDEDRLGVTGLSYGGYMTNWLIGHTDRFKAAVSRNSLTNMYSAWGTSDIGWMGHEISRAKTPWKDTQFYLEQSPIHYIANIKTPLLLTHCEEDHRCPMEQSEQLYTGLKKLGREVEFVRFPGESHVMINIGTPKHRTERMRHILRWFDRYLNKEKT